MEHIIINTDYKYIARQLREAKVAVSDPNRPEVLKRTYTSMIYGLIIGVYHSRRITCNQMQLATKYIELLQDTI